MSKNKINYNQFSESKKVVTDEDSAITETIPVIDENPVVEEELIDDAPKTINGVVTGCKSLNVRVKPSTNDAVVCVIKEGAKVLIDNAKSTDDWFGVCTETGAEGFCMKKFIEIQP